MRTRHSLPESAVRAIADDAVTGAILYPVLIGTDDGSKGCISPPPPKRSSTPQRADGRWGLDKRSHRHAEGPAQSGFGRWHLLEISTKTGVFKVLLVFVLTLTP